MKTLLLYFLLIPMSFAKVVVDESCFKDNAVEGISREEIIQNLEANLRLAEQSIFWCEYKYPGINKYTNDWRKVRRDFQLKCVPENQKTGAYYERNTSFGQTHHITLVSSLAKMALTSKNSSADSYAVSTLIHEIFHGTSANIENHNDIERVKPSEDCTIKDSTQDKISVLESLCSGRYLNASVLPAKEELYKKIKKCGLEKGCMNAFMNEIPMRTRFDYNLNSDGMSKDEARNVCQDFYYGSECQLLEDGKIKVEEAEVKSYFAENDVLKKLFAELKQIRKDMPTSSVLPLKYIESSSELKAGHEALKNSACFKRSFKVTDQGVTCVDESQKLLLCSPKGVERDPRCEFKTKISIQMFLNHAYKGKDGRDLSQQYDKFQDMLNLRKIPTLFEINQVLVDKKFQRAIGVEKALDALKKIRDHYPGQSSKHCTDFDRSDMKLIDLILKNKELAQPSCS